MIRFFFRSVAVMCLAVAVIFAVVDVTQSIGASALVLTPLSQSWDFVAPGMRDALAAWLSSTVHPFFSDPVLATLVGWPTFAVFGGLALVLALFGRARRRRAFRSL